MNVVPQGLCMLARGSHSSLHTPLLSNPTDSVADLDPVQGVRNRGGRTCLTLSDALLF